MIENEFERNQPFRPPDRRGDFYKNLKQQITAAPTKSLSEPEYEEIYRATTIVKQLKGVPMDEQKTIVDIIFKPNEIGQKLRPAEIQLLLAYMGEILKGIEEEGIVEPEKDLSHE